MFPVARSLILACFLLGTRFWFSTMLSFDPSNFRKDVFSVTLRETIRQREPLGPRWFERDAILFHQYTPY